MSDARRVFEIESRPEMARYQAFEPRTLESSHAYVADAVAAQNSVPREWYEFVVCLAGSGHVIGRVGCRIEEGLGSLWYAIEPEWQGKGLATLAVRQLMAAVAGIRAFRIECDPRNEASWRLAERLGFSFVSEVDRGFVIKGEDCGSKEYLLEL